MTVQELKDHEEGYYESLKEDEGFTEQDIEDLKAGKATADDIRESIRHSKADGEEEGIRQADERIRRLEGKTADEFLAEKKEKPT